MTVIETVVGRPLREAEQAINILGLDTALNTAKDELHRAIDAEKRRGVRRMMRGQPPALQLTVPMISALELLFRLGQREAQAELVRLGYGRVGASIEDTPYDELRPLLRLISGGLAELGVKLRERRVEVEATGAAQDAVRRAMVRELGARGIAAATVSTALFRGMGRVWEQASDLVGGWEYTAVLDQGTCDECAPLDGEQFPSWEAIQEVLPGGGPNPECLGEGRCRCRAVPIPA